MPSAQSIAVVESTANIANIIKPAIDQSLGYTHHVTTAAECLAANEFAVFMVDLMLDETDGLTLIEDLRLKNRNIPIVAYIDAKQLEALGMEEQGLRKMALDAGANALFMSPLNLAELVQTLQRMLEQQSVEKAQPSQDQTPAASSAVA